MSESAVCNSSCLIGLERIDRTDILELSFDSIYIPQSLQNEIGFTKSWLTIKPIKSISVVQALSMQVGAGEAEAIALALEIGNVVIILDDRKARNIAERFTLQVTGTVGILLCAKKKRIVNKIRPILNALNEADFRISDKLYRHALELAQEN